MATVCKFKLTVNAVDSALNFQKEQFFSGEKFSHANPLGKHPVESLTCILQMFQENLSAKN